MYRGRDQGTRGGAEHLARIHGTEEDKVNCPFYFKIGACRHGDKCSRQHHRPPFSETILIKHMWDNPMIALASAGGDIKRIDKTAMQESLDDFYEEVYDELLKFGKVEDIQVCENLGDHMVGNVYVKFSDEEEAEVARQAMHGRFFACRPMFCEHSPVTDFREARCRQFDEGTCQRGPYCNFMHIHEPSRDLRKHLEKQFGFRGGKMTGTGGMDNINSGGRGSRGGGGDRYGGGGGGRDRGGRGRRDSPSPPPRDRGDRDRERKRVRSGSRDRERR